VCGTTRGLAGGAAPRPRRATDRAPLGALRPTLPAGALTLGGAALAGVHLGDWLTVALPEGPFAGIVTRLALADETAYYVECIEAGVEAVLRAVVGSRCGQL
jgi:hypothetical protein